MKKKIIGVMGSGNKATSEDTKNAFILGKLIAENNYILLTGGRNVGVMDAASRGAKQKNGLTIGIMPTSDKKGLSEYVDIPIITGMGSARNNINVLSSDVLIAVGIGPGTASEIALALKAKKDIILLDSDKETELFFKKIGKNLIESFEICQKPQFTIINGWFLSSDMRVSCGISERKASFRKSHELAHMSGENRNLFVTFAIFDTSFLSKLSKRTLNEK